MSVAGVSCLGFRRYMHPPLFASTAYTPFLFAGFESFPNADSSLGTRVSTHPPPSPPFSFGDVRRAANRGAKEGMEDETHF